MNTTQPLNALNDAISFLIESQQQLGDSQQQQSARADNIERRIEEIEERQQAIEASLAVLHDIETTAAMFGWKRGELPLADWMAVELARGRGTIHVWAAAFEGKVAS